MKGRMAGLLLLILGVFLLLWGIYERKMTDGFEHQVVLISEDGFDNARLQQLMEGGETDPKSTEAADEISRPMAAWTKQKELAVADAMSGRSSVTDVIFLYGSSRCLLPYGENLQPGDGGCLMGEGLAKELFGTADARGQSIAWQGKSWVVRGVVKEPSGLLLLEASDLLKEVKFDRLNVLAEEKEDIRLAGEHVRNRYGFLAKQLRLDYYRGLSWLTELVPGKWSDFNGWKENFRQKQQELNRLANTEKSMIEMMILACYKGSCLKIGASLLLFAASGWKLLRRRSVRACVSLSDAL